MQPRVLSAAPLFGLALTACGTGSDPVPPNVTETRRSVEIYSWWSSPSEAGALERIFEVFSERNPNVAIRNAAEDQDGGAARAEMRERRIANDPPDLFQLNPRDLSVWTEFAATDGDSPRNTLAPLDDLLVATGALEHLPADIIDVVSYGVGDDRHAYAVPINVHRQNGMFYNKDVFTDANLTVPESLDAFFAVCDAIEQANATRPADARIAPLALSRQSWILVILFRAVVAATAEAYQAGDGAAYLHRLMRGEANPSADAQLLATLRNMNRVFRCANQPADDTFGWDAAAGLLQRGEAAMYVHGDWVKGELVAQGASPGDDFDVVAAFGTSDLFLYNVDGFAMFSDAPNPVEAELLLDVMTSVEAQAKFNQIKGSSPARDDVPLDGFDAVAARTIRELGSATWVESVERDSTPFWDVVGAALTEYWTARQAVDFDENVDLDDDVEALLTVVEGAYPMLQAQ